MFPNLVLRKTNRGTLILSPSAWEPKRSHLRNFRRCLGARSCYLLALSLVLSEERICAPSASLWLWDPSTCVAVILDSGWKGFEKGGLVNVTFLHLLVWKRFFLTVAFPMGPEVPLPHFPVLMLT